MAARSVLSRRDASIGPGAVIAGATRHTTRLIVGNGRRTPPAARAGPRDRMRATDSATSDYDGLEVPI
jgi:hypothetical protein